MKPQAPGFWHVFFVFEVMQDFYHEPHHVLQVYVKMIGLLIQARTVCTILVLIQAHMVLGGPGVAVIGVLSWVTVVMITIRVLIGLFMTSPRPPSGRVLGGPKRNGWRVHDAYVSYKTTRFCG